MVFYSIRSSQHGMFYHLFNVPLCSSAGFLRWILCISWELYSLALLLYMGPVAFQVCWPGVCCPDSPDSRAAQPLGTTAALAWPCSCPRLCPANPRTQQEGASSSGHHCRQGQRSFSYSFLKQWCSLLGVRVSWEDCGLHLRKMIKCCPGFLKIHGYPTSDTSKDHN